MALNQFQSLQSLPQSTQIGPVPVLNTGKQNQGEIDQTYRTLSMIERQPTFNLPPFERQAKLAPNEPRNKERRFREEQYQSHDEEQTNGSRRRRNRRREVQRLRRSAGARRRAVENRRAGHSSSGGFSKFVNKLRKKITEKDEKKTKQRDIVVLQSTLKFPGSRTTSSSGGTYYPSSSSNGPTSSSFDPSSSAYNPSSSSGSGYKKKRRGGFAGKYAGKGLAKGYSSSSSSGGPVYLPKEKQDDGLFSCGIARTEKGDGESFNKFVSIGLPLVLAGSLFSGSVGGGTVTTISAQITAVIQNLLTRLTANNAGRSILEGIKARAGNFTLAADVKGPEARSFAQTLSLMYTLPTIMSRQLKSNWKNYKTTGRLVEDSMSLLLWRLATKGVVREMPSRECSAPKPKDSSNDVKSSGENEIVLRMLDDFMMSYKDGGIPKCTKNHICKLNKAATASGQPQSTLVPLMSFSAAWSLGKPSTNVKDFLDAIWVGRKGKDCDQIYPECTDVYSSKRGTGNPKGASIDMKYSEKMEMDELLKVLKYLEVSNNQAPGKDGENHIDEAPAQKM